MSTAPRDPAVAGRFHPGEPARARTLAEGYVQVDPAAAHALAIVVPHAGWMYTSAWSATRASC